ncbi:MAG: hypothetical protein HY318_16805 [Armatimonadetes bacterium]|nr:hypothetical protein [Armatimonadota bacterium]
MAAKQLNRKPREVAEPPAPLIYPPLTPEEKVRMAKHGITEEEVARDPGLRFAGAFADDPEFMPMMREEFRRSRGREMPEWNSSE